MQQIESMPLWIGHAGEGRDFRQVFALGIRAVVDVAMEEKPAPPPRELIYQRIPIVDGAGNHASMLNLAICTIASLLRMHLPTLVCCGSGMSRAPALTAAALSLVLEQPPETCLQKVITSHPHDISPGLWQDIVETLAKPPSMTTFET
jgi:hypothetical protein